MYGNDDGGNSMPEPGKAGQAIECLADIRLRGGTSSGILVFESEQRDGRNEQGTGELRKSSNKNGIGFWEGWKQNHNCPALFAGATDRQRTQMSWI